MKLDISEEHLRVIAAALGQIAYQHAAPVIAELQKQVDAANAANAQPAKSEPADTPKD
jgi:hypothetical protein